ncbi:MAG TPA: porin family protein [Candidatus Coprenecus pullistercoris]|nr:porin family protein [Candidatus Coprenecus pullistercoris]
MKDELFDRRIKELAESYEETPRAELWERIESGMDRRVRAVRLRRIWYCSAAAAAVAGLFAAVFLHDINTDIPAARQEVVAVVEPREPLTPLERIPHLMAAVQTQRPAMDICRRPAVVPEPDSVMEAVDESQQTKSCPKDEPELPSIYDSRVQGDYIAMAADDGHDRAGRRRPSFSIAASGRLSAANSSGNVDFSGPSYAPGLSGSASSAGIRPIYDIHHYFPVSVGLELRYSFLNDRLGVGLGVNYTFLFSNYEALIDFPGEKYQATVDQSIHYIGVPLNFYVNILSGKRLSFYANAGCMMEKAVGMSYDMTDLYGAKYRKDMDPHGVQWSANVGLGLEYRFLDFLGVYVDPRLTYFFDCGQPYSVRTEQPLQFNLELGFRFHI